MNLINREALMFSLVFSDETGSIPCEQIKSVLKVVKAQPIAQTEIVMCADCQKYIDYRCRDEHANLNDWRHEDDYCSFGKRREDSNESKERP